MSTYLVLNSGQTSSFQTAQWPQVIEAYSTTVTLASAPAPRAMSPLASPPVLAVQPATVAMAARAAAVRAARRLIEA